jgi:hypothetical protein
MNYPLTVFKHKIQWLGASTIAAAALLLTAQSGWCGSQPVPGVTTGDSSATGTINFAPPFSSVPTSVIETPGVVTTVVLPGGTNVTVSSVDTSVNAGNLTQAEITSGVGVGGLAVALPTAVVSNVVTQSQTGQVSVNGVQVSIATALTNLSSLNTTVTILGRTVTVGQVLTNLSTALGSSKPTLLGTTLNDAAIVIRQALRANPGNQELKEAAQVVRQLLQTAKKASKG